MATKPAKKAENSTPKSNKGGSRAGAGRKPKTAKAVTAALITIAESKAGPGIKASEVALNLFIETMNNTDNAIDIRLKAAAEILNRTTGKPRPADAVKGEGEGLAGQVHIYIPDNGRDTKAEAG